MSLSAGNPDMKTRTPWDMLAKKQISSKTKLEALTKTYNSYSLTN